MEQGPPESSAHREWELIQQLGKYDTIQTYDDYVREVSAGIARARAYFQQFPVLIPSAETLSEAHRQIFERVLPWAGTFRQPDQYVRFGRLWKLAVNPEQILFELGVLELQCKTLIDAGEPLKAVVLAHVRIERIHPFLDGNGRVGRLALQSSLAAKYGFRGTIFDPVSDEYMSATRTAGNQQSLGHLMRLVSATIKVPIQPGLHLSPYRVDPDPHWNPAKTVETGLQESRRTYIAIGSSPRNRKKGIR